MTYKWPSGQGQLSSYWIRKSQKQDCTAGSSFLEQMAFDSVVGGALAKETSDLVAVDLIGVSAF